MKKRLVFVMAILLAGISLWGNAQQKPTGGVESFTVNGLKVILKSIDANEIISARLCLRGGSLNLTEPTQGIESLIFSCAVKGSKNYPKEKLNAILDKTASAIVGNAGKDMSTVSLRCLKSDFDQLWDAYADVVMNPSFVQEDVEVVRKNMLLGIRQRGDNPESLLNDVAEEVFYAGHPYRLDPTGVESSVSSITIDQMKKHLADNLVTSKLLLVVVGNVKKSDLQAKVEATFGKLPAGGYKIEYPRPVDHAAPTLKTIERPIPTTYVRGGFPLPAAPSKDFYSMLITMEILTNRIFEEVRTKRNLSYAAYAASPNRLANEGYLYVTTVKPDSAVKVMAGEMRRLQDEPVTAKDLKDRISVFLTVYNLQRETNESQAGFLAFHEIFGLGWEATGQFVERMRSVSAEDIQRVAKTYFKNLQFVVIGDPKQIDPKAYAF